VFQEQLLTLQKPERHAALDTLKETLIKTHPSLQGDLNLIHETAASDDSASLPL
jgi:hypothetical protein